MISPLIAPWPAINGRRSGRWRSVLADSPSAGGHIERLWRGTFSWASNLFWRWFPSATSRTIWSILALLRPAALAMSDA